MNLLRAKITTLNCGVLDDQSPQALGVTCWFDARPDGDPYDVDFTYHGSKEASGPDQQPAAFAATRTVTGVLPGVGTMAYTARFADIDAGEWALRVDGSPKVGEGGGVKRSRRSRPPVHALSAFAGFGFHT